MREALDGIAEFRSGARGGLLAAALLAILLPAGGARAHDLLRLSGGVANQWAWTDSLDALQDSNRLLVGELRFGVGVWEGLSVEVGYRYLTSDGTTFETWDTDLRFHAIDLAARYDWPLLSWLSVYGRAGGTAAYVATRLSSADAVLASSAWAPGVFAAAGLGVRFPRRWFGGTDGPDGGTGFTIGLGLDIGYAWFGDVSVSARPDPRGSLDADSARHGAIGQSPVDVGTLSVHGLTYQLGLTLHY